MPIRAPRIAAAVAAAAAVLAAPAAAPAAVTCDSSSGVLTVALDAGADNATLSVVASEIKVVRTLTPVTCTGPTAPPTVTNTGVISVTGDGDDFQSVVINGADDFVPGPAAQDGSDTGTATDEIEIFVNLNDSFLSSLQVATGDGNEKRLIFGTGGVNANSFNEVSPDADIFPSSVESVSGFGGSGHDRLSAAGGLGTGNALTEGIFFQGHAGFDTITGGDGPDALFGGSDGDTLHGEGGNDAIHPGADNDSAHGNLGTDTVGMSPAGPVAIDLAVTGVQSTGEGSDIISGFENATTDGSGPATLRGDDGPNVLTSEDEGDDTLEGRGGADVLSAQLGADTLLVRDGGPDTADCGGDSDSDTAIADPVGVDSLTGCRNVIFPPPPTATGGDAGAGGSGGEPGGGQAVVAAFGPQTLVTLALASRRIPPAGPVRVRVSNANGFDVSGTLSGQTAGRLSAAQRRRRIRLRPKSFTVAANARRTVRLRLPRALRRQLARRRSLSLRLTASVRDPAGNTRTVRRTLRPRLRRR